MILNNIQTLIEETLEWTENKQSSYLHDWANRLNGSGKLDHQDPLTEACGGKKKSKKAKSLTGMEDSSITPKQPSIEEACGGSKKKKIKFTGKKK